MKRLLFSTKALWHQWRALKLARHAYGLLDAAEAHGLLADGYLLSAQYLARAPVPDQGNDAGKTHASEPSAAGCSFAGQMLIGVFIAGLWIWI
jgi:hypothetical protein